MSKADNRVRLFVAADISLATVRVLTEVAKDMKRVAEKEELSIKWVAPANYHVTLKFLGWTKREALTAIKDAVTPVLSGFRPFTFKTGGAGVFPKADKARVLWAGIEDRDERLAAIAKAVDQALEPLGYPKEKRAFHPHVTLGRFRTPANAETVINLPTEQEFSITRVDSVLLYESIMKSTGSEYLVRHEWPLESASRGDRRQTKRVEQDLDTKESPSHSS